MTCLIPSVQRRLAEFDVMPANTYLMDTINVRCKNRQGATISLLKELGLFKILPISSNKESGTESKAAPGHDGQ